MFTGEENTTNKNDNYNKYDKEKLEKIINNYDKEMLTTLSDLYASLTGERLDLNNIANTVDLLSKYNDKSEYNYLNNLLMPEKCKNVKIPSPIPVPSCSFQLHNCVTLTPNSQGNIGILFNPFFLVNNNFLSAKQNDLGQISADKFFATSGQFSEYPSDSTATPPLGTYLFAPYMLSSLLVNSEEQLTGTESCPGWKPVNINQNIPGVYDQYRLVSASVVVKYIGRLDIVSGVIGGAVIFDEHPDLNGMFYGGIADGNTSVANMMKNNFGFDTNYYNKYGNFDLAMDSFYHQENLCLEGLRQLYFPLDNSYEEYCKLINSDSLEQSYRTSQDEMSQLCITLDPDNYKSGFNFFIYTLGAPHTPCLKLDIYCNYECLPNAKFLNYMPTSVSNYGLNSKDKKEVLDIIQKKPIMKANETIEIKTPETIGWKGYMKDMAKRFKNGLPPMNKLTNMITSIVPKIKPAISVVGTMIGNASQNSINTGLGQMEEETPNN